MGAVDLEQRAREQAAQAQADGQGEAPEDGGAQLEPVEIAVVIFKRGNGQWVMTHDLSVVGTIMPQRTPTHDDLIGGMAIIRAQMTAQMIATMSAQATVQMQAQMAQAMAGGGLPADLMEQLQHERRMGPRG